MTLRFRVVLSGACALLAVLLCLAYADSVRQDAVRQRSEALARYGGEVVSLVVAPDGLEVGDVVSRTNVTTGDWVAELTPEDAITSVDDAVGRKVTVPLAAGAPLTRLNFREDEQSVEVPAGHVALSVAVSEKLGLWGGAPNGTRVAAYEAVEGGARLMTDDVTVLRSTGADGEGSTLGRSTVTIAVPPDSVSAVLSSSTAGTLRLVMPAADVSGLGEGEMSAPTVVGSTSDDNQRGTQ